ncbi:MAG: SprT family zinc-dependent metalloprotease [Pseudomonadota bacterium]
MVRRLAAALLGGAPELPASIVLDEPPILVTLSVQSRARRFTLRLNPSGAGATLTLPPGVPEREVHQFLHRQRGWLSTALGRLPEPVRMREGARLPIGGEMVALTLLDGPRRAPVLDDGVLTLSGQGTAGPRIAAWLKERARARMVPAVHAFAAQLGRAVRGVALKDTRSRWGSCSTTQRINLSWRLAMAPPEVQDYLCAHEAAHLVEMNHSPRYWAVLAGLMPRYDMPRQWLKTEGPALHRYRFDAE